MVDDYDVVDDDEESTVETTNQQTRSFMFACPNSGITCFHTVMGGE
jgi:hypothetical protein